MLNRLTLSIVTVVLGLSTAACSASTPAPTVPLTAAPQSRPVKSQEANWDLRAITIDRPEVVAYVNMNDVAQMREFRRQIEKDFWSKMGDEGLAAAKRFKDTCGFDLDSHIDEAIVYVRDGEPLIVFTGKQLPATQFLDCVAKVSKDDKPRRVRLNDAPAVIVDDLALVAARGLFVIGPEPLVTKRLSAAQQFDGQPSREAPDFRNSALYIEMTVSDDPFLRAIAIRVTRGRAGLRFAIELFAPDAGRADVMANAIRRNVKEDIRAVLAELAPAQRERLAPSFRDLQIRRRVGERVQLSMPSDGALEIHEVVPSLIERLVKSTHRFVLHVQAKERLWALAKGMTRYAKSHPFLRNPAYLPSAPRTKTSDLPTAKHPWNQLGFTADDELPFAFEIVTAADRRRSVVRAIADLDQDGVESVLELSLGVDADGECYVGAIRERGDRE